MSSFTPKPKHGPNALSAFTGKRKKVLRNAWRKRIRREKSITNTTPGRYGAWQKITPSPWTAESWAWTGVWSSLPGSRISARRTQKGNTPEHCNRHRTEEAAVSVFLSADTAASSSVKLTFQALLPGLNIRFPLSPHGFRSREPGHFPHFSSVQIRPSTKPKRSFKISCSRLLKWPRAFSTAFTRPMFPS